VSQIIVNVSHWVYRVISNIINTMKPLIHYQRMHICCALAAHSKSRKTHGNGFTMRFLPQRTAKAARQWFARQSSLCRALYLAHNKKNLTARRQNRQRGPHNFAVRPPSDARQTPWRHHNGALWRNRRGPSLPCTVGRRTAISKVRRAPLNGARQRVTVVGPLV
jgi:hypothetical protein